MLLFCPGKDQDVIQIDHYNVFYYEVSEDIVHYSLEGGRTVGHSNKPQLVQKAAFHLSLGLMQMLLKSQQISSLVKYLALQSCDTSLEISERGYLFLTIMELSPW